MAIAVLTYHALNISGNTYASNDHVALAADLELVTALGWRIVPLHRVVDALLAQSIDPADRILALSFDDGSDFDYRDLPHPEHGLQRSMLNILRDFAATHPEAQPRLHATSFVVASAEARAAMDRVCIIGQQWMNEGWWAEAVASGLMGIANHSWDHNHAAVPVVAQRDQQKGNFFCIDTEADADAQIRAAARYLDAVAPNPAAWLFGYPYGHVNDYLRCDYLPRQARGEAPFVSAAFGTEAGKIGNDSDRWNLPRYVCGWHWKSADQLAALLAAPPG